MTIQAIANTAAHDVRSQFETLADRAGMILLLIMGFAVAAGTVLMSALNCSETCCRSRIAVRELVAYPAYRDALP